MHPLRTRIKREIVAEFLPAVRRSDKVIILCGGVPSYPGKGRVMEFLSRKGFWVFAPRYRGSWESGGAFLAASPEKDVADVMDQVSKGWKDLWSGKMYRVEKPVFYLVGSSFGGAAVLLASREKRVAKTIALSPVSNWRTRNKTAETIEELKRFSKEAFGEAYRPAPGAWRKLRSGKFYNPISHHRLMSGEKIFIIHPRDDKTISVKDSAEFAKVTRARLLAPARGGHLSLSAVALPRYWKVVRRFFLAFPS